MKDSDEFIIVQDGVIRIPTDEEVKELKESGVLCTSRSHLYLEEELRKFEDSLQYIQDDIPVSDNQAWKKSNKHSHPAFKKHFNR